MINVHISSYTHIAGDIVSLHQTVRGQSDPPTPSATPTVLDSEGGGAKHRVPASDDHVAGVARNLGHLGHGEVGQAGAGHHAGRQLDCHHGQ